MKTKYFFPLVLFIIQLQTFAQNITARITDAQTNEPLQYANVKINGSTDLVSNDEGFFNFNPSQLEDSSILSISFIGYVSQQLSLADLKKQNLIIKLTQANFELENITISNKKPDPIQIIAEAAKRLKDNYKQSELIKKNRLFLRDSEIFKPSKLEIDITESTGFTKKQLKDVNADIQKFSNRFVTKPAQEFQDVLCDYYKAKTLTKDNKVVINNKLDVIKATKIRGNGEVTSLDDIEHLGTNLLLKHLDTTKYYRIKSGWFGSRDTVSLNKTYNNKQNNKKAVTNNTISTKFRIYSFVSSQQFNNSRLDFITNSKLYSYTLEKSIFSDIDNDIIHVIKFKPRKNKAIYSGTLYINESDYAIVKCNYELAEGKKVSGLNLKLLLGVKVAENHSKGTLIYKKNTQENLYDLQYAYEEEGQYFYINRPLKFIELAKSEKDVVAFHIKVEGNAINKTELLNFSQTKVP